jgi:hypothetical protein
VRESRVKKLVIKKKGQGGKSIGGRAQGKEEREVISNLYQVVSTKKSRRI